MQRRASRPAAQRVEEETPFAQSSARRRNQRAGQGCVDRRAASEDSAAGINPQDERTLQRISLQRCRSSLPAPLPHPGPLRRRCYRYPFLPRRRRSLSRPREPRKPICLLFQSRPRYCTHSFGGSDRLDRRRIIPVSWTSRRCSPSRTRWLRHRICKTSLERRPSRFTLPLDWTSWTSWNERVAGVAHPIPANSRIESPFVLPDFASSPRPRRLSVRYCTGPPFVLSSTLSCNLYPLRTIFRLADIRQPLLRHAS